MSKVLVLRLSAFGDVAMLVPVIYSAAKAYPDARFVVLTRREYASLFKSLDWNIETKIFDPKEKHKGFWGLVQLARSLKNRQYTHVADLHDVIRSKVIRSFFLTSRKTKIGIIDKGRKDKNKLIKTKSISEPLISNIERYRLVFADLGFDFPIQFSNIFDGKNIDYSSLGDWQPISTKKRIGIAPFARHKGKIFPLEKMEEVVKLLSQDPNNQIFLFGGNEHEKHLLKRWENSYPNTICTVGKLFLREELLLMNTLDVLVSMDSANMHLASLVGTPVVSIWGATHPSLGFYGFHQSLQNAVQSELDCRPCSVYGNKPCARKDYACLHGLEVRKVLSKVEKILRSADTLH